MLCAELRGDDAVELEARLRTEAEVRGLSSGHLQMDCPAGEAIGSWHDDPSSSPPRWYRLRSDPADLKENLLRVGLAALDREPGMESPANPASAPPRGSARIDGTAGIDGSAPIDDGDRNDPWVTAIAPWVPSWQLRGGFTYDYYGTSNDGALGGELAARHLFQPLFGVNLFGHLASVVGAPEGYGALPLTLGALFVVRPLDWLELELGPLLSLMTLSAPSGETAQDPFSEQLGAQAGATWLPCGQSSGPFLQLRGRMTTAIREVVTSEGETFRLPGTIGASIGYAFLL